MSTGRGGKPPKMTSTRTPGGWADDEPKTPISQNELSGLIERPISLEVWKQVDKIYSNYITRIAVFENPLTAIDHKQKERSLGYFRKTLLGLVNRAAEKMNNDISNELSHDLASLVSEQLKGPEEFTGSQISHPNPHAGNSHSLRRHMHEALDSLRAIGFLLENVDLAGEAPPWTQSEVRRETGLELKKLAIKYDFPQKSFVQAFGIHETHGSGGFDKWYARLE